MEIERKRKIETLQKEGSAAAAAAAAAPHLNGRKLEFTRNFYDSGVNWALHFR